jgi:hypothetical protein
MWDITDPAHPVFADVFRPNLNTIPHNAIIRGDLAFISHYELGVFVVDVSNRNDIRKIGGYDTHPEGDFSGFRGAWGVFPFFPNSPRVFVASDIERGLFVLELEFDPAPLADAPTLAVGASHAAPDLGWPAPNPIRVGSETRFELVLAQPSPVSADVFDVRGRIVRSVAHGTYPAGRHSFTWDGRSASGAVAASGTYLLRVRSPSGAWTRSVTLLR